MKLSVKHTLVAVMTTTALSLSAGVLASPAAAAGVPLVDLKVLVLDDQSPMVTALADRLDKQGVPFTTLDLSSPTRPTITGSYLTVSDTQGPHARYQAVIAPTHRPSQLTDQEVATLFSFEKAFGVRQVSAYNWPSTDIGLNSPVYSGAADGLEGRVTSAAKADGFSYLAGPVPFEDRDASVLESYVYLGTAATSADGRTMTPLVTAPIPGTSEQGVLLGALNDNGREELVGTFAANRWQHQTAFLAPGIIEWVTRGVHLGFNRNYFSVHVDDVFLPDALWSIEGNCTIGDGCDPVAYPEDAPSATVRMTADDVRKAKAWQGEWGFTMDMAYNGFGVGEYRADHGGTDAMFDTFKANATSFRWINHTWEHPYLGCVQDFSTTPWRCATNADGSIRWQSKDFIKAQIEKNTKFATDNRLPINPKELVTGEHSGLKTLPQMVVDNPNLGPAMKDRNVDWVASDASRETTQRLITETLTVPRHPMNIFYNVSTEAEEVDEYNWIYTSRADGGSGICEDNPATTTCITPLSEAQFDTYIVPLESHIALGHVAGNDPMPHYAHQSNIAKDGVLYPVLESVLAEYRRVYDSNSPLVTPTMTQSGTVIGQMQEWNTYKENVSATLVGTKVTVKNLNRVHVDVPITSPMTTTKTDGKPWTKGTAYAGSLSGWVDLGSGNKTEYLVPGHGYLAPANWSEPAPSTVTTTEPTQPSGEPTLVEEPNASDSIAATARAAGN